jgi:hypothetical protein
MKGVDGNGCPIWIEPANPAHRCGEPRFFDAGAEQG